MKQQFVTLLISIILGISSVVAFANARTSQNADFHLSISSNKSAICAGGVDSAVHQATITATLKDAWKKPIKGAEIHFFLKSSNAKYPASLNKSIVVTGADGKAVVTLTSSRLIGATAKVQASFQDKSAVTNSITSGSPKSTFTSSPEKWFADGFSVYNIAFTLTFNGQPVDGHNIAWSITQFKDYNGKVMKNPDADYGKIIYSDDVTDWDSGTDKAEYLTGWYGGTVTFATDDKTTLSGKNPAPARYVFIGGID